MERSIPLPHSEDTVEPQNVDTPEAARILGLAPKTLERWRWRGVGPRYRKLNGAVRYSIAELDAWADSCSRDSTSAVPAPEVSGR